MKIVQRLQMTAFHAGVLGCVLLGFAIPTSRALFNIAALLIILGSIFSGQYKDKWSNIRKTPLFWPIAGIWSMLLLGALYTSAPWRDVQEHWERYSKFFLVLMIISLLTDQRHRRWMWWAFITGCSVVLLSTYLNIFILLPWSKTQNLGFGVDHSVFIDYIAQSLVIGLFSTLLWLGTVRASSWLLRLSFFLLFVAAIFSITHLTSSRIGYGVALVLVVLLPLLSLPRRWAIYAAFIAALAILVVLFFSDLAGTRVQQVFSEAGSYKQGDVFTSTGARLHMWVTSINLWMQAPWFGHGTGAYHELAKAAFANDTMCQIGCFHPHNQFLFLAVDHGLVGLMLICAYLGAAILMAWKRSQSEKTLFLAFLLIFMVDALAHGPLWLFMEAYFSFGIMALLASGSSGLYD
ncbi:hypothetical protein B9Z45_14665 [Limnohabitans sp. 2KL-17]|uniref:O-antigen ligase family protein n=1 Tax=Limnohabitans sp. 2KL-17 TaxID=1100704 RepID=UPI000D3899AE|nr:O-antigen ligase family protein [Limnohabitans sp. 2KL-17]PUE51477.1 hypothetical protein B9Z45_14665 [Limnohabitans sp. 2KL-17]